MQGSLLQPDEKRTGITFDPRTKMFLLLTVAVFVLGGAGGKNVDLLAPMLCVLPVVLFYWLENGNGHLPMSSFMRRRIFVSGISDHAPQAL